MLTVPTVAVVGAGFSGTMTAVQIARLSRGSSLRIVLIEPSGRFGGGVAYGTRCSRHLLNVPAGNMSAFPDEPDHFVQWASGRGINSAPEAFVPRCWYGVYLHSLLEQAGKESWIDRMDARVLDIVPVEGGARIIFENEDDLWADQVILAGGNLPPAETQLTSLGLLDSPRYIRDPWKAKALDQISGDDDILLVGTGLTMIDVVVQLRSAGHQGQIHAVSRRGLLPQAHRKTHPPAPLIIPPEVVNAPRTALGLLKGLRQAIARVAQAGYDWRDVITTLRPRTAELWSSLSTYERERFLRHLRPFWDTHRHRVAAIIAEQIQRLFDGDVLTIHRARITSCEPAGRGLCVGLKPRDGSAPRHVTVSWVVNCTGPDADIRRADELLWVNLLARGVVKADELGLGVLTDKQGAIIDAYGHAADSLHLVGPLRKAQLWESTAVPELRIQAADLARKIVNALDRDPAPASPTHTSGRWFTPLGESVDDTTIPVFAGEYI